MILLNGLTAIKAQPSGVVDQFAWLWGSLMLVGGLYWLTVRTLTVRLRFLTDLPKRLKIR